MNRMQHFLARAAAELNLRVDVGFELQLASGRIIICQALFPDLGAARSGTLVFRWEDGISASGNAAAAIRNELYERGYGVSTFDEPLPEEQFNLQSYKDMFIDWGWNGPPEDMPVWMS